MDFSFNILKDSGMRALVRILIFSFVGASVSASFGASFGASTVIAAASEAVSSRPAETEQWIFENGEFLGLFEEEKKSTEPPTFDVNVPEKIFTPPADALKTHDPAAQITAVLDDLRTKNVCSKFANKDGFGVYGKFIIDDLMRGNNARLLEGADDLREACPAYDYLGAQEKANVWVQILAMMAFKESTCNPRASAQAKNGVAAGLLALHQGAERKYAPRCTNFDSNSAVGSLRCGLSILDAQIKRTGRLFSTDTHFGVLRPQGDLVKFPDGRERRVYSQRILVGGLKELPLCRR